MYELRKLIDFTTGKTNEGKARCLATIINTVGSSYRKTGTQMIISEDFSYEGALSGGCVENEVLRQAERVFKNSENIIFEYDGQYKLGCNGKIYVLIEPLSPPIVKRLAEQFYHHHKNRVAFQLLIQKDHDLQHASTSYVFQNETIKISETTIKHPYDDSRSIHIPPQHQLVIVGGEVDSVSLARLAYEIGYETYLVVKENFPHVLPSSVKVAYYKPEELESVIKFDLQTAIVLMTHSLSKDLGYLIKLLEVESGYLGILGPPSRKETILTNLMNHDERLFLTYADKIESIYGPVGLDIGAKTAEEISISVLSEMIAVFNGKKALSPVG